MLCKVLTTRTVRLGIRKIIATGYIKQGNRTLSRAINYRRKKLYVRRLPRSINYRRKRSYVRLSRLLYLKRKTRYKLSLRLLYLKQKD